MSDAMSSKPTPPKKKTKKERKKNWIPMERMWNHSHPQLHHHLHHGRIATEEEESHRNN
jgi:hypothetical protein